MTTLFRLLSVTVCLLFALPAVATSLTGKWEVQSMGGDREINIQQDGKKIVAHRVLWPEFEGEKYKLEHLYRGSVRGDKIRGELLVKDDELPEYEVLRAFSGKVTSGNKITLDGLPLKRIGKSSGGDIKTPSAPERPSEPPGMSKKPDAPTSPDAPSVVAVAPPPPPPAPAAPASPEPTGLSGKPVDPGAQLFASIMGSPGMQNLFLVSSKIMLPGGSAPLSAQGDKLFREQKYEEALTKYQQAREVVGAKHVRLFHRMGRCHMKLQRYTEAQALLRHALRLDPGNRRIKRDYKTARRKAKS